MMYDICYNYYIHTWYVVCVIVNRSSMFQSEGLESQHRGFVSTSRCIYIYIYIYICMYTHMYVYDLEVCIYIYIHMFVCVCVCVYIYIYIYIYVPLESSKLRSPRPFLQPDSPESRPQVPT